MRELHHKVPRFLGGSERKYNLEYVTPKEHFIKHLLIARALDTQPAWAAVMLILKRHSSLGLFREHWFKRLGKASIGKGNPFYGKNHTKESKDNISKNNVNKGKPRTKEVRKKISLSNSGEGNPMYGTKLSEEHKRKIDEGRKRYWAKQKALKASKESS